MNKPDPDLASALKRFKKMELIDGIVELAHDDPVIRHRIITCFAVQQSSEQCVADTRAAILAATDYDPRDANHNFDYDLDAYTMVEHNLTTLVETDQLEAAMDLAMLLMQRGSCQIVMSDEGLMQDDIEDCLTVVLNAVAAAPLDPSHRRSWLDQLIKADESQFVCSEKIVKLMLDDQEKR